MNWSDERYVRLFTRDTVTWLKWSFETRSVFMLLLRKVDRSGVLETGRDNPAEALAVIITAPIDACRRALAELTACGTVAVGENSLVIPRFVEAQECRMSDKARQKESREKRAAAKLQNHEDVCHTPSHDVTAGHTVSHAVTPAVPYRAVPYRAVPSHAVPVEEALPPPPVVEKAPAFFVEPTTPPDTWSAEDFFAWAQSLRQRAGLVGERRRPRDLSSWWSTCLMTPGVTVARMQGAFLAFGDSPHWQSRTPALPFAGFVSQWDQFLGREVRHAS